MKNLWRLYRSRIRRVATIYMIVYIDGSLVITSANPSPFSSGCAAAKNHIFRKRKRQKIQVLYHLSTCLLKPIFLLATCGIRASRTPKSQLNTDRSLSCHTVAKVFCSYICERPNKYGRVVKRFCAINFDSMLKLGEEKE